MSHEIEQFRNGEAAFVSARLDAWHQLGTVLDHTFTAEEALQHAHLAGWNVRKFPLQTIAIGNTPALDVPNSFANVRTNPVTGLVDVLGTVGSVYRPIQNEEHCELLNTLVDQSGAHFETAGSLKGGREVFITMQLPESMMVGGVDETKINIAALNSHDGNSSFRFLITPVRVVCANTQTAAIKSAVSTFSIRHTKNGKNTIEEARQALGLTFRYIDAFQLEAEKMIQETMKESEFFGIVNQIWTPEVDGTTRKMNQQRDRLHELGRLFTEAGTQEVIGGTRYAGYNVITEYLDHFAPVNLGPNADTDADARALRTLTQSSVQGWKSRAFDLLSV